VTFIPLSSAASFTLVQTPLHELVIMVASGGKGPYQIKDGLPVLVLPRSDNSDVHFAPPQKEGARDHYNHERSDLIARLTTGA